MSVPVTKADKMTENSKCTILVIDDEAPVRMGITAYLEDHGYHVVEAENGRLGLDLFLREAPDLILVDLRMPEVDGLEVLTAVNQAATDTPVIVVSGTGVISDAVAALRLGAWDFVLKPIADMEILLHAVCQRPGKIAADEGEQGPPETSAATGAGADR